MNLHVAIVTALSLLGTTPDGVAEALRGYNIQGARHSDRQLNPVIRFLQQTLRIDAYVLRLCYNRYPSSCIIRISTQQDVAEQEVNVPEPVSHFLNAFNDGNYPDLEMPMLR